jgi:hypothetical protein
MNYRAAIQFMDWNRISLMDSRDDPSFPWHHCGSLVCHDGVAREIFVYFDDAPGSSCEHHGFGLLLITRVDERSVEAPVSVPRLTHPREVIAELRRAGPFSAAEQSEFAAKVEALGALDTESMGAVSAADRLFDEVLSEQLGGWIKIGAREGDSLSGGFRTTVFARKAHDGAGWEVLERSRDVNSSCKIKDDGSGRTIFSQFLAAYYSDEGEDHDHD